MIVQTCLNKVLLKAAGNSVSAYKFGLTLRLSLPAPILPTIRPNVKKKKHTKITASAMPKNFPLPFLITALGINTRIGKTKDIKIKKKFVRLRTCARGRTRPLARRKFKRNLVENGYSEERAISAPNAFNRSSIFS